MIDMYVGLVWYLVCGFSSIKKLLVHAKCIAIVLLLSTLDKITLESSTTKHIDPEMVWNCMWAMVVWLKTVTHNKN